MGHHPGRLDPTPRRLLDQGLVGVGSPRSVHEPLHTSPGCFASMPGGLERRPVTDGGGERGSKGS
jgi:hypothetical protein